MKQTIIRFVNYCRKKISGAPPKERSPEEARFEEYHRDALDYLRRNADEVAHDWASDRLDRELRDEWAANCDPPVEMVNMMDTERGRRAGTLVKLASNLAFEGDEYEFMCDPLSEEQTQTQEFKHQQHQRALDLIDYARSYIPETTVEPDRDDPHEPDI